MTRVNRNIRDADIDASHELTDNINASGTNANAEPQQEYIIEEESTPTNARVAQSTESEAAAERLARIQAEFENARKRLLREQQEYREFALAEAVKLLLPVLDSFDRALQAPVHSLAEFKNGVLLIRKQLEDAIFKLGVSNISSAGEKFDPKLHEAVGLIEEQNKPDSQIVKELQRGYKLGNRVLRPAMVVVNRRHAG